MDNFVRSADMHSPERFKPQALQAIAEEVGRAYTGTEITEVFHRAGFQDLEHDRSTKWRWVYSALIALQARHNGPYNVCKVVEVICDPQGHFGDPEYLVALHSRVNRVLAFYGLRVRDDGKIVKTSEKQTTLKPEVPANQRLFDSRAMHQLVVRHSRRLFAQGNFFHAVFEACKAYDRLVADKGRMPDDFGTSLMGHALNLKNGPLRLNRQQSVSERNEQEGVMHLSMGLMSAVRNPLGHDPALDWPLGAEDALDLLSFVSYLARKVEAGTHFVGS